MPSYTDKTGKTAFSMNPQIAKARSGAALAPGMDAGTSTDGQDPTATDDHVELHRGGNPAGQPPPTESTQFHTIASGGQDIRNHDNYDGADQHMKEAMGQSDDMDLIGMDDGMSDGGE